MTRTNLSLLTLSAILLIFPLTVKGDLIFDPDNDPPDDNATTTPEVPSTPIDWVSGVEWGCVEGQNNEGVPFEQCGFGRYRRLCGFNAGVEDCHTFFEILEEENTQSVSNVLFLPGIKGSRLYQSSPNCSAGDCALKLWEPYGSPLVQQLYLDTFGKSNNPDVYARAGDVLSEAFFQEFYASFFADLDSFEENNTFGESWIWEAAAYDWRLSLTDIVERGARYDDRIYYNETNGTPYIEQLLRDLASSSITGRVSIVAHSNGGLVAKALMQKLGDSEASILIDKVVFVGVPQTGAPQALGAALFGHGEALPFDECEDWVGAEALCTVLVDRETARTFAEHSPMTYHLLPSEAYFKEREPSFPVARFNALHSYQNEYASYGNTIDSFEELSDYAAAREGGRLKPVPDDTTSANVLSEGLLEYAKAIHDTLDPWLPPPGVEVHQIAGWGVDTISGIEFYDEPKYLDLFGETVPRYRPLFFGNGDGVVPATSALHMRNGVKQYWVDLEADKKSHGNMLEMPELRTLTKNILTNSMESLPSHVSLTEPALPTSKKLLFFLHSPLTLGVRDGNGNYTGLNKDGEVTQDIANVQYGRFGDVQYLIAPAGEPYTLFLQGLAEGTFSLDVQQSTGGRIDTTTTIANVPVSVDTLATLTVGEDASLSDLEVDKDGDGATDLLITPKSEETVLYEPVQAVIPSERTQYSAKPILAELAPKAIVLGTTTTSTPTFEIFSESSMTVDVEVKEPDSLPEPVVSSTNTLEKEYLTLPEKSLMGGVITTLWKFWSHAVGLLRNFLGLI